MLTIIMLLACDNQLARSFGGTMDITVPCGQQVFDVTWKGDSVWYATQPAPESWAPATKSFKEYSTLGMIEGEVVLHESHCGS
jgi:hypothetical protein